MLFRIVLYPFSPGLFAFAARSMTLMLTVLFVGCSISCTEMAGATRHSFSSPESTTPSKSTAKSAHPETFPEVVARVNGTPLHKTAFLERANSVQTDMGLPDGDLPLQIYRAVLNEMVDMELLFQASQELDLGPDPAEIEQRYQALVDRFPSEEAFLGQLHPQPMTSEEFKRLMYKDMSVQKLIEAEFAPRVSVGEEAKLEFYKDNHEEMEVPEHLRIGHILVRVEQGASTAERREARQRIGEIRNQLIRQEGEFAELAREFSEDTESKQQGGESRIKRGQAALAFEAAAFSLEPGALSEIVETRRGYHLIKLYEKTPARSASYGEVEAMIHRVLEQRGLEGHIEAEIKELRRKASVELFI